MTCRQKVITEFACRKSSLGNVKILQLIVDRKQMQFNLPTEGNYRIRLFDQGGDAVPRSYACIPDRFQAILQSVFTHQKNVTFTGLPGIMLMNIGK